MKRLFLALFVLFSVVVTVDAAERDFMKDSGWRKIQLSDVKNPVVFFGKDWAALAAGKKNALNAMTVGWGQFGTLWGRKVVTVYVAPERYTNEFMKKSDYFTLTAFPADKKEALVYIGNHSGRDGDKLKAAGLTPEFTPLGNPIFKEGNLAVECKIIYKEQLKPELMDAKARLFYETKKAKPHIMYIGEVVNVWKKEANDPQTSRSL